VKAHKALNPVTIGLFSVVAEMSGAGDLADSIEDRMAPRNGGLGRPDTDRGFTVSAVDSTKRRIDFRWLSGKESCEMGEHRIGVGNCPMLLALVPSATLNLETAVEAYVQAQGTEPKDFSTAPQFTKMVNSSMASNG
jgi:hypothetical protein